MTASPMDEATLKALKGSIQKWEKIVDGTGKDNGASNCPLCKMFNKEETGILVEGESACHGCPVKQSTGQDWCSGSPYQSYVDVRWRMETARGMTTAFPTANLTSEMAGHAQAELDFLKSLLPVTP